MSDATALLRDLSHRLAMRSRVAESSAVAAVLAIAADEIRDCVRAAEHRKSRPAAAVAAVAPAGQEST